MFSPEPTAIRQLSTVTGGLERLLFGKRLDVDFYEVARVLADESGNSFPVAEFERALRAVFTESNAGERKSKTESLFDLIDRKG